MWQPCRALSIRRFEGVSRYSSVSSQADVARGGWCRGDLLLELEEFRGGTDFAIDGAGLGEAPAMWPRTVTTVTTLFGRRRKAAKRGSSEESLDDDDFEKKFGLARRLVAKTAPASASAPAPAFGTFRSPA